LKAVVYHGIAASLLIGMAIVVYATGSQGLNTYGTCSFKESLLFAYTGIAFVIFYLLLGSYTLYCFRKQIPDDPAFRKYREKFLNYYTQYIRWTVIIWAVLSVSRVVVTINMQLKTPIDTLFIFVTIDNIAKLAAPVVLTIIRYRNPSIKPVIDRFFRKSLCCCCKFKPKWVAQDDKQIALVEHSGSSCSELELNWFGELTSSIRLSQLYTILVGLNNNLMHRIA
jgi:1-phosphatidylinositol-4-phosphate 5-kinase